ncbi:hypothetical protein WA026_021388 [Henosepilachna vigintioctopunctata]|uniref:Uncharacterized protein n=1 Tax=Henosepilachna vigintioctopunctata TaxID=420089 RepID=A0AAW1TZ47_9CUCU
MCYLTATAVETRTARNVGDFTASEEKCFPLLKRKILLYCPECRKEAGDINRGENCKIENEVKLEQKNSENKKLLKENDQLKKTIEKIEIENRNLQNGWDKLKEDKDNLETVITTLKEQITHLNEKIQRCS